MLSLSQHIFELLGVVLDTDVAAHIFEFDQSVWDKDMALYQLMEQILPLRDALTRLILRPLQITKQPVEKDTWSDSLLVFSFELQQRKPKLNLVLHFSQLSFVDKFNPQLVFFIELSFVADMLMVCDRSRFMEPSFGLQHFL